MIKLKVNQNLSTAAMLSPKRDKPTQETIDKMKGKEYKIIGNYMVLVDKKIN